MNCISRQAVAPHHFIHYLPRVIVTRFPLEIKDDWFRDVRNLNRAEDFARPRMHVTQRASGPSQRVCPGDVIWLVSQVHAPWGSLPVALDARLAVQRVTHSKDGETRYHASGASEWFPLKRAASVLRCLKTMAATEGLHPLLKDGTVKVGQALQSMREVANPQILEQHADRLRQAPLHFVSYRIADGTRAAFHKVGSLMARGHAVFWDRWSLPRRLAERREALKVDPLNGYLMNRLSASSAVWCVMSPAYAEPTSYSEREFVCALAEGTFRPVAWRARW